MSMWTIRLVVAAFLFSACFFAARSGLLVFGQQLTAAQSPSTVEISERFIDPLTKQVKTEVRLVTAYRSDGSKASSRSYEGQVMSRRVSDLSSRRTVVVVDNERAKSTKYYSERDRQAVLAQVRPVDCSPNPKEKPVRQEFVLGIRAFVFESDSSAGPNRVKLVSWLAPDLKCSEIKSIAERMDESGLVNGRTEKVPVLIRMGEPDDALFAIPADYKEMTPSAMQENSWLLQHKDSAPLSLRAGWITEDQKYYASQQHRP